MTSDITIAGDTGPLARASRTSAAPEPGAIGADTDSDMDGTLMESSKSPRLDAALGLARVSAVRTDEVLRSDSSAASRR